VHVPHAEPTDLGTRLRRRFRYGTSAAPLTRRHPGVLVPLVLEPWTAAALLAAVTGRPKLAATLLVGAAADEVSRRRTLGLPARGAPLDAVAPRRTTALPTYGAALDAVAPPRTTALPTYGAALALAQRLAWTTRTGGGYLAQTAAPLALAGLAHRRTRIGVAALLLAEPVASWWTRRGHATDPVRWTATHLAEDVAYGAGVLVGCARARTVAPLLPRIRRVRAQRRTP
jgi:hypothetical protein